MTETWHLRGWLPVWRQTGRGEPLQVVSPAWQSPWNLEAWKLPWNHCNHSLQLCLRWDRRRSRRFFAACQSDLQGPVWKRSNWWYDGFWSPWETGLGPDRQMVLRWLAQPLRDTQVGWKKFRRCYHEEVGLSKIKGNTGQLKSKKRMLQALIEMDWEGLRDWSKPKKFTFPGESRRMWQVCSLSLQTWNQWYSWLISWWLVILPSWPSYEPALIVTIPWAEWKWQFWLQACCLCLLSGEQCSPRTTDVISYEESSLNIVWHILETWWPDQLWACDWSWLTQGLSENWTFGCKYVA